MNNGIVTEKIATIAEMIKGKKFLIERITNHRPLKPGDAEQIKAYNAEIEKLEEEKGNLENGITGE